MKDNNNKKAKEIYNYMKEEFFKESYIKPYIKKEIIKEIEFIINS